MKEKTMNLKIISEDIGYLRLLVDILKTGKKQIFNKKELKMKRMSNFISNDKN
ncbi:MAG: hypothetical protein PHN88_00460 [Ignavibacteria bacterium]|nr:hypothetical protein [Ignavibacteria bacterium]